MHVLRLSPANMGGNHNLQDLVKQANLEISNLNSILDSFPVADGQAELFEQEIKQ